MSVKLSENTGDVATLKMLAFAGGINKGFPPWGAK